MAYDVEPSSDKWREIVECADEETRWRLVRNYIYELERDVNNLHAQNSEANNRIKQLEDLPKQIAKIGPMKKYIDLLIKEATFDSNNYDNAVFNGEV